MAEEISLKNIIGEELLNKIQNSYLKYLESSAAIYEMNGDYAAALFSSEYCDFLNQASKRIAGKTDDEALKSGRWICHEDCWATSLKSIKDKKPCEMECSGGIKIYAVPIIAEGMVIGSNNAGVSDPPTDAKKIKEIAERYKVDPEELLKIAEEYTPRPKYVLDAAKNHILVVSESIAEIFLRKQAEEVLKEREIFLFSVLEGIGDGVVIIDRDFKIISANSGYLKETKNTLGEIIGKHCYEVSHHSTKPCYLAGEECSVKNVFETGISHRIIHTHFDKNNKPFYVSTIAYPLKDSSGNVLSAIEMITDGTEKVKLDKELEKRIEELEEFYEMAVGRELNMIELKEEIERLEEELKKRR